MFGLRIEFSLCAFTYWQAKYEDWNRLSVQLSHGIHITNALSSTIFCKEVKTENTVQWRYAYLLNFYDMIWYGIRILWYAISMLCFEILKNDMIWYAILWYGIVCYAML